MNGKEQTERYAALPGQQFKPGDLVDVQSFGRAEVLEVMPGALLRLRTATRCPVIVKASACKQVRL